MKRYFLLLPVFGVFILTGCIGGQKRAPVVHYGQTQGAGSAGVHTVISGDTLWSISKRYKISMQDIAVGNKMSAPFMLKSGQRLKLPPPREYKVHAGDSLYTVSRLFGVSSSEVARLNGLSSPYVIHEGESLRLPSARGESASSANIATPGQKPDQGRSASSSKKSARSTPTKKTRISAKTPKRASSKFKKPVEGRIISNYGPKKNGLHNDGINIKAPKGSPVRAADNGVIVYAGSELKGSGNLVLVRHEGRWMTAYAHMDRILVKRGSVIKRGQSIGTVGSTGSVDSPQLHFEVRRGTEAINPKRYLE